MVDFLIITPLQEELDAVLAYLEEPIKRSTPDGLTYYISTVISSDSATEYQVGITVLPRMGNLDAAINAMRGIQYLKPKFVLVVGIAGGFEGKVKLGDVVVATDVWYYELGAVVENETKLRLQSIPVDPRLLEHAQSCAQENSWRALLSDEWRNNEPAVHFGRIAGGDKVIRNRNFIEELAKTIHGLLAVEMESYAVAKAAAQALNRPRFLTIRGISDYADNKKDDGYRNYASATAAAFTVGLIKALDIQAYTEATEGRNTLPIIHASLGTLDAHDVLDSLGISTDSPFISVEQSDLYINNSFIDPYQAINRQADLLKQVQGISASLGAVQVAYFAVAHIPLLFHAGLQLSTIPLTFYERNRYKKDEWKCVEGDSTSSPLITSGLPSHQNNAVGDVVVLMSISDRIDAADAELVVPSSIAMVDLSLATVQRDVLTSQSQLIGYGQQFRQVLDDISRLLPNATTIHIFYAGPPSLAVYLGQLIKPSIERRVIVYNFSSQDQPRYGWATVLTGSTGPDDLIVEFRLEDSNYV